MGKKIKIAALAFLIAVIAYVYPTAKQKYVKLIKPKIESAVKFVKRVANLKILGKPVPWRFILPVACVLMALLYVRRRKRKLKKLKEEEERKKAELAAQYRALGGPAMNPEQDNQAPTSTSNVTPKPTVTPSTTNKPDVALIPTENENREIGSRIQTFGDWSSTNTVNVFALARAGFQYTGRGDVVECFQCKGTLKEWVQDDDPLAAHHQYYPNCEFVKKRLSEADVEKLSCSNRISDLLTTTLSSVDCLKEILRLSNSARGTAQKHLADLQKRLDTTERTMHLVMKQMETVTKCLARTLENDPAGDPSEINDGLKVMKESNV